MPTSGFPSGVHLGGANAAITLAELAREFYAPIIPAVMELRRQGLSLRAIGRELERRGIKPRFGFPRWSAAGPARADPWRGGAGNRIGCTLAGGAAQRSENDGK